MENQPQNPEFRYNPENFHPCLIFEASRFGNFKMVTYWSSLVLAFS